MSQRAVSAAGHGELLTPVVDAVEEVELPPHPAPVVPGVSVEGRAPAQAGATAPGAAASATAAEKRRRAAVEGSMMTPREAPERWPGRGGGSSPAFTALDSAV